MDYQITYDKMFGIMKVKDIIIFEDIFPTIRSKNGICYGLVRMSKRNRRSMLDEIEKVYFVCKEQLSAFLIEFDKVFNIITDWENTVPYNDIETSFRIIEENVEHCDLISVIREKYDAINIEGWIEKDRILNILYSYGAGLEIPALYDDLFDEYIQKEQRWKSFRIFRDFSAMTEIEFKQYVGYSVEEGTIICILDDQLRNGKCAREIANCIEKMQSGPNGRLNIIGLIYSSFDNKDCISDKIYFEYITKKASKRRFQAALTKSAYSQMLSKLKEVYTKTLELSFDEAVKSKNIAYYLSSMADCEGITNYQVITNWIKLLFEYKLNDTRELTGIASMTQLINLLEDEKVEFSKEMLDLNTFEAFDFNVNKYRQPIASGDIFIYKKDIFILIGQDCDMMYSSTRTRKNGISELVKASTVNQCNLDNSVKLNSEYVFVSNFRKNKDDKVKTLKIRYSSREFVENQILQLCQFNDEGECKLNISEPEYMMIGIEPLYYEEMYSELVSYFNALLKIGTSEKQALEVIINSRQSKRLLTLTDYDIQSAKNGMIYFGMCRICRLKHPYMLYLYKMYLEYQGRHPFDCMNMSRVQEIQVKIVQKENLFLTVDAVLTPDREINRMHIGSLDWYVDTNTLESTMSQLLNMSVVLNETQQYIEIVPEATTFECILESGVKKMMQIEKINDTVSITECADDSKITMRS